MWNAEWEVPSRVELSQGVIYIGNFGIIASCFNDSYRWYVKFNFGE